MYERILVPLDGSERAEAILPHVAELARRFSSDVVLIQVVEPLPPVTSPGVPVPSLPVADIDELTATARSYLAGIADRLGREDVRARLLVPYGKVVESILEAMDLEQANLIAIASHGRGGLAQLFYGSVASALLQHADRPLLMVRSRRER